MFSGIVETTARVVDLKKEEGNLHITLSCPFADELKIDQSVAHNGVCLTVIAIQGDCYTVTAISETLLKSNLGELSIGDEINVERSMRADGMLDGHIVQGHVDTTATCTQVREADGSHYYRFEYEANDEQITVEKGSVTVNGVSLTVCNSRDNSFEVAIIPYTYEHTNFHNFRIGTRVNLEFDILGKYIAKLLKIYLNK
ncbi:Riboflavin synthase eubacterial/eukaryotic [Mucinivorans hirudinis]|uniref:Riboflavin synthase n=1 Tax=Mucinivorans hirudinis TaxID=1433126 RepID=A0A060R7K1_9BACT|nr:Riboflavin synthase eubacterial/eukaryotic [Mucinivorans hirudinis]